MWLNDWLKYEEQWLKWLRLVRLKSYLQDSWYLAPTFTTFLWGVIGWITSFRKILTWNSKMRGPPHLEQGGMLDALGMPSGLGHSGTAPSLKQYLKHCSGAYATRVRNICMRYNMQVLWSSQTLNTDIIRWGICKCCKSSQTLHTNIIRWGICKCWDHPKHFTPTL
jgi:hypothetical protein